MGLVGAFSQTVWFNGEFETTGVGKTVTKKDEGVPGQPFNVGVTVTCPVMFAPVALTGAFHDEMLLVPLARRPMEVLELVHVNVAPIGSLPKIAGLS